MELETPQSEEVAQSRSPSSRLRPSRTGFFSSISRLFAPSSFAGARAPASIRLPHDTHPQPHKAERVAMEEVRRQPGAVRSAASQAAVIHNPEASADAPRTALDLDRRRVSTALGCELRCSSWRCFSASASSSGSRSSGPPQAASRWSSRAWKRRWGRRHSSVTCLPMRRAGLSTC